MIWDVEDDIDSSPHSEGIDIISPATTVDIRSLSGSSMLSDTYMGRRLMAYENFRVETGSDGIAVITCSEPW